MSTITRRFRARSTLSLTVLEWAARLVDRARAWWHRRTGTTPSAERHAPMPPSPHEVR